MKTVVFHPLAEPELIDAVAYYEEQRALSTDSTLMQVVVETLERLFQHSSFRFLTWLII